MNNFQSVCRLGFYKVRDMMLQNPLFKCDNIRTISNNLIVVQSGAFQPKLDIRRGDLDLVNIFVNVKDEKNQCVDP